MRESAGEATARRLDRLWRAMINEGVFDGDTPIVADKIKPCPFCGPNMIEHLEIVDSKEGLAKVVKCWACGCIGPYGASNEKLAIEFWNTRQEAA